MIVREGGSGFSGGSDFFRALALCLVWDREVKSLRKGVGVGNNDSCMA